MNEQVQILEGDALGEIGDRFTYSLAEVLTEYKYDLQASYTLEQFASSGADSVIIARCCGTWVRIARVERFAPPKNSTALVLRHRRPGRMN